MRYRTRRVREHAAERRTAGVRGHGHVPWPRRRHARWPRSARRRRVSRRRVSPTIAAPDIMPTSSSSSRSRRRATATSGWARAMPACSAYRVAASRRITEGLPTEDQLPARRRGRRPVDRHGPGRRAVDGGRDHDDGSAGGAARRRGAGHDSRSRIERLDRGGRAAACCGSTAAASRHSTDARQRPCGTVTARLRGSRRQPLGRHDDGIERCATACSRRIRGAGSAAEQRGARPRRSGAAHRGSRQPRRSVLDA